LGNLDYARIAAALAGDLETTDLADEEKDVWLGSFVEQMVQARSDEDAIFAGVPEDKIHARRARGARSSAPRSSKRAAGTQQVQTAFRTMRWARPWLWGSDLMGVRSGSNAVPPGDTDEVLGRDLGSRQIRRDMEDIFGAQPRPSAGESSAKAQVITPVIRHSAPHDRTRRIPTNRMLALTGMAIAGALVISTVVARYDIHHLGEERDTASSPPAAQIAQAEPRLISVPKMVFPVAPASLERGRTVEASAAAELRGKSAPTFRDPSPRSRQRAVTKRQARRAQTAVHDPCDGLDRLDLARCMRPQVVDADQQLRDAYHDAVRAGVDRRVLVAYRRQWSRLRDLANTDPQLVVGSYRQIARELDAERASRPAGDI
jgi:hypothetical protein